MGLYKVCIVGRVALLTFCCTYLLLLGNAAFSLRPLCIARDLGYCDHDYKGPGRFWFPHPPRPGFSLCTTLGVWRSVRKTAEPGSFVAGLIHLSVYPSNTTRCRPPLRGVKGLRS